ncbi:MAG TPA: DUF1343 domain-containing protein [Candidatus Kapabacteria bacterium]|nr:DUF1343 domain-containing protein [Candidatus Kapabacteria bacterium]
MQKNVFLIIFILFSLNTICFAQSQTIELGIDILQKSNFSQITSKRVALLTNFSGRDSKQQLSAEILRSTSQVKLTLILTPEHGFYGNFSSGANVDNSQYKGIPVLSLYGNSKIIPYSYAEQFDAIIVDIQDIGVRAYTFISTLYYVMQSAAEYNKPVIILDRPNPLGGMIVDGNVLDINFRSYIGLLPVPYIYGMTIGEIATMMNEENWLSDSKNQNIKCNLTIIKMQGWERWMQWEDTQLPWFPTSPNISSPDAIRGIAMLGWIGELSLFSIGIGTNMPFQYFGSPDFSQSLIEFTSDIEFTATRLFPTQFQPTYGKYANQICNGFFLIFEKDNSFCPFSNGIELLLILRKFYPELFKSEKIDYNKIQMFEKATGTDHIYNLLFNNGSDEEIRQTSINGIEKFIKIRQKYLLY